jgi:hypothetical protein
MYGPHLSGLFVNLQQGTIGRRENIGYTWPTGRLDPAAYGVIVPEYASRAGGV